MNTPTLCPTVFLNPTARCLTGRTGTLYGLNFSALHKLLGCPHFEEEGKCQGSWHFQTSHGPASIWMHWWNAHNEWSLGGSAEARLALVEHLQKAFPEARQEAHGGSSDFYVAYALRAAAGY